MMNMKCFSLFFCNDDLFFAGVIFPTYTFIADVGYFMTVFILLVRFE